MRVVRLLKPGTEALPEIRKLFDLALKHGCLDIPVAVERLCKSARDPRFGIFIGLDPTPKSLMIVILPQDPRTDRPLVDIGTNIGSRELGKLTLATGLDFIRKSGYNTARVFNFSGRSDKAYVRAFRHYGIEAKPLATLLEFTF